MVKNWIGLLILGTTFLACGSMKRKADLELSVEHYVRALSHGDSRVAATFVEPKMQTKFLDELRKAEDFRISNSEVRSIFPDDDIRNAIVTVFLEYYPTNGSQVFSEERHYAWKYNADAKGWLLAEAAPFGDR